MTSMPTAMATKPGKSVMKGHRANIAACPAALSAHIFFGPKRSTSLPIGSAARNAAIPARVRPRPTCAADRPTIWVKNTAEPVMKAPSPSAKSSDWAESRPASGDGGRMWRRAAARITRQVSGSRRRMSRHFRQPPLERLPAVAEDGGHEQRGER
jgi:hypothetical protein